MRFAHGPPELVQAKDWIGGQKGVPVEPSDLSLSAHQGQKLPLLSTKRQVRLPIRWRLSHYHATHWPNTPRKVSIATVGETREPHDRTLRRIWLRGGVGQPIWESRPDEGALGRKALS